MGIFYKNNEILSQFYMKRKCFRVRVYKLAILMWPTTILKVRPHEQQFSHTTLYNKVVQHKTCHGYAKSCCATNVHTPQFFL